MRAALHGALAVVASLLSLLVVVALAAFFGAALAIFLIYAQSRGGIP